MRAQQQGATLIGVILLWSLLAFFIYLAMCLTPIYLENYNVKSSLHALQGDPAIFSPTNADTKYAIREALNKRLNINDVNRVTDKNIVIEPTKTGYEVKIVYDATTHIIANIDLVVHFRHAVELKKP
jgi:hypothetical protein